jgi:lipoate-protein ligase A
MVYRWRLLDLGELEPLRAQALYEAVAVTVGRSLAPNTLITCYPARPYVCIGFHQELEKEIDVDFCREKGLPIVRRSQGGGAVYLDSNQQFYQIVARKGSPEVPARVEDLFEKFLRPTVYTCRRLGLPAEYKPINDVVVCNRKISGNGAGELDNSTILVGNIILDLDYDAMCRALKVPSEKFRDKLAKSMREWVTSIKRELGHVPSRDKITKLLTEAYVELGINLVPGQLSKEEEEIFSRSVKPKHLSKEWLYLPMFRHQNLADLHMVKVEEGVIVKEACYKAKKMVRVTAEVAFGRIRDIVISGDFFMIPENALTLLEERLLNVPLERERLETAVRRFYKDTGVQVPGVAPEDFVEAIMMLK